MARDLAPRTATGRRRMTAAFAAAALALPCAAGCTTARVAGAAPAPVVTALHGDVRYSALGDDPRLLVTSREFMIQPVGHYVLRYDRDGKCLYVEKDAGDRTKQRAVPVWIVDDTARPLLEGERRGLEYAGRRIMDGDSFTGAPQGTPEGLVETFGSAGIPFSCGGLTELTLIGEPVPAAKN